MPALNIRKGDRVRVIAGKGLGKEGRVIGVIPSENRVVVEGVNRAIRHEKVRPARGRQGQEGGLVTKEMALNASNVALICPTDGPTRAGFRTDPEGLKIRVCAKCEAEL